MVFKWFKRDGCYTASLWFYVDEGAYHVIFLRGAFQNGPFFAYGEVSYPFPV